MAEAANGVAAAQDATVVVGRAPDRSRLERAAGVWEQAVDRTARMRRKVAKLTAHLDDAQRALDDAEVAEAGAVTEFEDAKTEIGG